MTADSLVCLNISHKYQQKSEHETEESGMCHGTEGTEASSCLLHIVQQSSLRHLPVETVS
jgi:hypothetical protein